MHLQPTVLPEKERFEVSASQYDPARIPLIVLFSLLFLGMVTIVVRASIASSIPDAWDSYAANPWAVATLWDAYAGFTIFWIWVAAREASWGIRFFWLILIYALGNIATAFYVLIHLIRLRPGQPVMSILARQRV